VVAAAAEEAQHRPRAATAAPVLGRERLLLDFGWRFHFGHAADAAQDFNFRGNSPRPGISARFRPRSSTITTGSPSICLTMGHRIAVPERSRAFQQGVLPAGANLPATSVGWYRRVFELPPSDAGKRITLEFDGRIARPQSSSTASTSAVTSAAMTRSAST